MVTGRIICCEVYTGVEDFVLTPEGMKMDVNYIHRSLFSRNLMTHAPNPDYPGNYIREIMESAELFDITFVEINYHLIQYMELNHIPFDLIQWSDDSKDYLIKLAEERLDGITKKLFIDGIGRQWNAWCMGKLKMKCNNRYIITPDDDFSDVIGQIIQGL